MRPLLPNAINLQLAPFQPTILRDNQPITPQNNSVPAGLRINLSRGGAVPPGRSIVSQSWTVQGGVVAGYTQDSTLGRPTPYVAPNADSTNFYWIDGSFDGTTTHTVTYSITLDDAHGPYTATANFTVLKPNWTFNTYPGGTVGIDTSSSCTTFPQYPCLSFGTPDNPGFSATANITTPANPYAAGQIAMVQLVDTSNEVTITGGSVRTSSSGGQYLLDSPTGIPQLLAMSFAAGASRVWVGSDTPGLGATASSIRLSRLDNFKSYLVYKPDGSDSNTIWVTLAILPWHWSGVAVKSSGTWILDSGVPPTSGLGTAAPSSELPVWSGRAQALEWIQPDFSLGMPSPSPLFLQQAQMLPVLVPIASANFSDNVSFTCSVVPAGSNLTCLPASVSVPLNLPATATIWVQAGGADGITPQGSYGLTITGTSSANTNGISHTTGLTVNVPQADFMLGIPSVSSMTLQQGGAGGPVTFSVTAIGSFSDVLYFTCSSVPAGLVCPSASAPSGAVSATVMVQAPASLQVGAYQLTIAGADASGLLSRITGPVAVNVVTPPDPGLSYMVGDAFPWGTDHTAPPDNDTKDFGEFGNNFLDINDQIYALRAVTGIPGYMPSSCSDLFDAMDSFPADTNVTRGGDAILNILDLIITLNRVTGVDPARPRRLPRGLYCPAGQQPNRDMRLLSSQQAGQPNLTFGSPEQQGGGVRVPVYVHVNANKRAAGIAFGIRLKSQASNLQFTAAAQPATLVDGRLPGLLAVAFLQTTDLSPGKPLLLGWIQITDISVGPADARFDILKVLADEDPGLGKGANK